MIQSGLQMSGSPAAALAAAMQEQHLVSAHEVEAADATADTERLAWKTHLMASRWYGKVRAWVGWMCGTEAVIATGRSGINKVGGANMHRCTALFARLQAAKAVGKGSLGQHYGELAGAHTEAAVAARARANVAAFYAQNASLTNTFKVDLHGLNVEEALQVCLGV